VVPPHRAVGTVWGQVRSEKTGAPLRYAVVEVLAAGYAPVSAATDSNGVYVLRDVLAGRRLLRATHIDHAPHEVEILVVVDRTHPIDFDLEFRPVRLTAVTAEGARALPAALDTSAMTQPDLGPAAARVLESTPGVAELGLAEAAREVPGHEPVDPSDVLYVRGGVTDVKLVMLNGIPVYAPFHVGGLIDALDADVLRAATLYVGGAPARYDGGLSYVMDLETRSARRQAVHGRFALDMLSAKGLMEGPATEHVSLLVTGRAVHGLGTGPWLDGAFPYSYGDALARADISLGGPHTLTATGFWNDEEVRLDTAVAGVRQLARWGNRAGSLRYRGTAGASDVLGTVALGHFRTMLPLSGIQPLLTEGTSRRVRVAADVERPLAGGRLSWGGSIDRIHFEYRAFPHGTSRDSSLVTSSATGAVGGLYLEAAFAVLPRVRVRGGLRTDYFSEASGIHLTPRLSATMLLTDRATLTLAGGQYRQYVRTPERSLVFLGEVSDPSTDPGLRVAEATHLVLALAQDLGDGIRLGLEGFYKEFTGLEVNPSASTEASGVDLWVRRNGGDGLSGWLGYSLAWVWSVDAERPGPAQAFSGRHLVSGGVAGPFFGEGFFDVRVSYGAGLPFTAIPEPVMTPSFSVGYGGSQAASAELPVLPTEPQDPYLRLDAQLSRTWNGSVGEFAFQLTPYVKVLNALNRRDAIFYHYNRDAARAEPLAGLSFLPIVGAEWRF
jgi:hypothetical protein